MQMRKTYSRLLEHVDPFPQLPHLRIESRRLDGLFVVRRAEVPVQRDLLRQVDKGVALVRATSLSVELRSLSDEKQG